MPSSPVGRKLTDDEQARAETAIATAPKDVWLIGNDPLYPTAARPRNRKAHKASTEGARP